MGYEVFEFAKTTINIMQTIIVVDNFRLALAELCSSTTHFNRKPSSCVVKVGRLLRETMPEPTCVKIQLKNSLPSTTQPTSTVSLFVVFRTGFKNGDLKTRTF